MRFIELAQAELPEYLSDTVARLLELKMHAPEVKLIPKIDLLNAYFDRSMDEIQQQIKQYPKESTRGWEELNEVFLSALTASIE